jgi:hypothetical protein
LMEINRTSKMAEGRFVDLDFDNNNSNSLKAALVDINTAAATIQISAALKSKALEDIIPSIDDRTIFASRIRSYVVRSRNKAPLTNDQISALERLSRIFSTIGAAKALGTILQAPKQVIPVAFNTAINAGANFNPAIAFSKSVNGFINRSGRSIANRGIESQSGIEAANSMLDKAATSRGKEALGLIEKVNSFWLKMFLAKPDVFIARSAWIAYYKQDMKRQGLSTDIDFDNDPINDEAADYAQHMIDRQQNISDTNMAGEFMASEDSFKKMMRNVLLPFSSFILNQKSRMYSDLRAIGSSTSSAEDRRIAINSLSGLGVEMITYHGMGFAIRYMIYMAIANALTGEEPSDEEKEKMIKSQVQTMAGGVAKDLLSPLPLTDKWVIEFADYIAESMQNPNNDTVNQLVKDKNEARMLKGKEPMTPEEEKDFREATFDEKRIKLKYYEEESSWGTFGIAFKKYEEYSKLKRLAEDGIVEVERNGKIYEKKVEEKDREAAKAMVLPTQLHMLGLLPADVTSINRYVVRNAEKNALTENQYEKLKGVKKELEVKDLPKWQEYLVKSNRKQEGIIKEIEFIERFGGLKGSQQDEYIKLMERKGNVNYPDLKSIQSGVTADEIIKKDLE